THAFCDTDSMAIVSTQDGGLIPCHGGPYLFNGQPAIRALSWEQTDHIVEQFENLNPYNLDTIPGSVLEIEKENFSTSTGHREQLHCQAISAKRYVLYNTAPAGGTTTVRKDVWEDPDDPDPDARTISVEELRKRS